MFIQEKQEIGTYVGTVKYADHDLTQRHFCRKFDGDDSFNVTSACDVITAKAIDGVLQPIHRTISVVVYDASDPGPSLTSLPITFHITVLLINEPPILISNLTTSVRDSELVGTVVYQVKAFDREVRLGDTVMTGMTDQIRQSACV